MEALGGGAVSCERGTPVSLSPFPGAKSPRTGRPMVDIRIVPNNALRTLITRMVAAE